MATNFNIERYFPGQKVPATAIHDLAEGRVVAQSTATGSAVYYPSEDSALVIGYVQDDADADAKVTVIREGVAMLEAAAVIALGVRVGTSTSGRIKTYSSGQVIGITKEAASASGDHIEVWLQNQS